MPNNPFRVISYGGGTQSTALMIMAAERIIDFPILLYANVGEKAENPETLAYFHDVAVPYCKAHGLDLREVRKRPSGKEVDLFDTIMNQDSRSMTIPVYLGSGQPFIRTCTADYKVKRIAYVVKHMGATVKEKALVALGISIDEYSRVRHSTIKWQEYAYPLIDRRMSRQDCIEFIGQAGLPVPPKSSCFFCPFHTNAYWRNLSHNRPDLFRKAISIEEELNRRRKRDGRDRVYLHNRLIPLHQIFGTDLDDEPESEATCDVAGYCNA